MTLVYKMRNRYQSQDRENRIGDKTQKAETLSESKGVEEREIING